MPHVLGNPNEAQIYTDSHWVAPFQQKISSTNMDVNTWLGWYNASVYASRQRYGHAKLYPQVISILHFRYPIAMNMHICVWKCPQTNTHTRVMYVYECEKHKRSANVRVRVPARTQTIHVWFWIWQDMNIIKCPYFRTQNCPNVMVCTQHQAPSHIFINLRLYISA